MIRYVAFLRGINVGGNSMIKMVVLKAAFESLVFENVKTILNSGNVIFETDETKQGVVEQKIEKCLDNLMKRKIRIIVRSIEEIQQLVEENPFKDVDVSKDTRLYVTFLSDTSKKSSIKIPYSTPDHYFQILFVSNRAVCSSLIISKDRGSIDLMNIIEKEFGHDVTTRNWNTVVKIAKM